MKKALINGYKMIAFLYAVLYAVLFGFTAMCAFLPFREDLTFYAAFRGFFGEPVGFWQPCVLMALPFLSAVFAGLSVKHPGFSAGSWLSVVIYGVIVIYPIALEETLQNFAVAHGWLATPVVAYQEGFYLMEQVFAMAYYIGLLFMLYAVAVLLIRSKEKQD